jgi:hypothetical protein
MSAFAPLQRKNGSSPAAPAAKSKPSSKPQSGHERFVLKQEFTPRSAVGPAAGLKLDRPLRALSAPALQTKLTVGEANDAHEREADAVADALMAAGDEPSSLEIAARPAPGVQRACACDEEKLRRKPLVLSHAPDLGSNAQSAGDQPLSAPLAARLRAHQGRGAPLPSEARSAMEQGLGVDLSGVRIHDDQVAHELSQQLKAQAFTAGNDVYFNRGRFSPNDRAGRRLLAHELTHVVQQSSAGTAAIRRTVDEVLLNCADRQIHFQHDGETTSYALDHCDAPDGEFDASVTLTPAHVDFTLNDLSSDARFDFRYSIAPGQPNPNTFFAGQRSVRFRVSHMPGQSPGDSVRFNVRSLSAAEFQQMTGRSLASLPERVFVPSSNLGLGGGTGDSGPSPVGPVGAGAALFTPTPFSFIPANSTGVIWSGQHLSVFANPESAFLPTVRGYRGGVGNYLMENIPVVGDRFTIRLHEGVPGSFANDVAFPFTPNEQNFLYVAREADEAAAFAQRLRETQYGGRYRYSPPRPPGSPVDPFLGEVGATEGRIYEVLVRRGIAPLCTNNCTTVPAPEVEAAIGMRPRTPSGVDVMSGRGPTGEVNPAYEGRARLTGEAFREGPLAPGVSRLHITAPAAAAMGFIRVGGAVLMIYGAYRTGERIANAPPEQLPIVVGEEAGSWVGGVIGTALGTAAGAAIFCLPSGPVDFICIAGGFVLGAAAGALGSTVGVEVGHSLAETVTNTLSEFEGTLEYEIKRLYGFPF